MSLKSFLIKELKNRNDFKNTSDSAEKEHILSKNDGLSYNHPKTIELPPEIIDFFYVPEDKTFRKNLKEFLEKEAPFLSERSIESIVTHAGTAHDRDKAGLPPLFRGISKDGNPIEYIVNQYKDILSDYPFTISDLNNVDPALHNAANNFFKKNHVGVAKLKREKVFENIPLFDNRKLPPKVTRLSDLLISKRGRHQTYYLSNKTTPEEEKSK